MKAKGKSKINNKKVPLTKSLGELMKDEDGFVSKETILKVGLSTIAALGMTSGLDVPSSEAQHTNTIVYSTPPSCSTHTNVTLHSSY